MESIGVLPRSQQPTILSQYNPIATYLFTFHLIFFSHLHLGVSLSFFPLHFWNEGMCEILIFPRVLRTIQN
jgi:hypothetical protein